MYEALQTFCPDLFSIHVFHKIRSCLTLYFSVSLIKQITSYESKRFQCVMCISILEAKFV